MTLSLILFVCLLIYPGLILIDIGSYSLSQSAFLLIYLFMWFLTWNQLKLQPLVFFKWTKWTPLIYLILILLPLLIWLFSLLLSWGTFWDLSYCFHNKFKAAYYMILSALRSLTRQFIDIFVWCNKYMGSQYFLI